MKESLKNAVVQGFKDGSISLSTLRLLKNSMSAEELKSFVNSAIDSSGNKMMDLTSTKEIAEFLVSAGASRTDKSYEESKSTSTGPSKMRERFENRDNIPDFPDVPKTTRHFGTVQSQSTLDKGAEGISITSAQYVLLENLTNPKTNFDAFKKIMESNPGKFFRDNINADLDGKGNTLLHLVKNDEIREYLIAEHKANARARNNEGKTYNGRTDSKKMEFVPNTRPMETLRFETKVNSPKPAMTNQYGPAPALTDAEAKHALPKKPPIERTKTQYGQLLSDEALAKNQRPKLERQHSAKLTTLVADDARPKLERQSKLTRADVEIQKLTSNSPLSDEQKKESQIALNKIRPDLQNLQRDNPRPKLERKERIDLNLPFAAYRLSKLSEEAAKEVEVEAKEKQNKNTGKPTKKSILKDKAIKAKMSVKDGAKNFAEKVKASLTKGGNRTR